MSDETETIGNSLVRHGPGDELAYLMKLHPADAPEIIRNLEQLAFARGYSKVSAKVPAREARQFVAAGYHLEATIPCYFQQKDSACFMSKFLSEERKKERQPLLVREVLVAADAQQRAGMEPLPTGFALREAAKAEAGQMALFYRELFTTKKLALHDPDYFTREMQRNSIFLGVWKEQRLVALCGALVDHGAFSAEMAGLAVLPECKGDGLELHLLQQVEKRVLASGIGSAYALVRACSLGDNVTFARNGYRFGGTLTNNSNIHGRLESANVWYKGLPDDPQVAWSSVFESPGNSRAPEGPIFQEEGEPFP